MARGDFRCGRLYGIDVQFSAKVLIFHDKTIWRKQLCNFHDCGCRGTAALQTHWLKHHLPFGIVGLSHRGSRKNNISHLIAPANNKFTFIRSASSMFQSEFGEKIIFFTIAMKKSVFLPKQLSFYYR